MNIFVSVDNDHTFVNIDSIETVSFDSSNCTPNPTYLRPSAWNNPATGVSHCTSQPCQETEDSRSGLPGPSVQCSTVGAGYRTGVGTVPTLTLGTGDTIARAISLTSGRAILISVDVSTSSL